MVLLTCLVNFTLVLYTEQEIIAVYHCNTLTHMLSIRANNQYSEVI